MSPDRYGDTEPPPPHHCGNGWIGETPDGRPIPCLICKPHLARRGEIHDSANRPVSDRARAAIEKENRNA